MKLRLKNKVLALLTGALALLLGFAAIFAGKTIAASAEENTAGLTAVPDDKLVQLSDESETMFYSLKTGATVVRYTPAADKSYTLENVSDIAMRLKNGGRQCNTSNTNNGLTYIQFKFKGNDTVWNIKNESFIYATDGTTKLYTHYTFLRANGTISKLVGTANAAATTPEKGAMLSYQKPSNNFDGTLYIPLTMIYNDNGQTDADRITAVDGYEDLELEYIEFEVSTYRYDLVVGDIATIDGTTYEPTVMELTKELKDDNSMLLTDLYDDATIKVNGQEGVKENGKVTATVDGIGSVTLSSDKVRFFKTASVSSELNEGYGITNVITKLYNDDAELTAYTKNPLSTGYVYSGEYDVRSVAKTSDVTQEVATPVQCVIEVTVAPLVKLNVTGENTGVTVSYGTIDTSATDNRIYLANNSGSTISVVPNTGFSFVEAKLNGEPLTNESATVGEYIYTVKITAESELEIIGTGDPVDLTVEKAAGLKATVAIGEKTFADDSETYSTFYRETLSLIVTPTAGYAAKVEKVVLAETDGEAPTVTELTADGDNVYKVYVDGGFTLRVSTSIVTYTVTYRLNGGAYATGESNPETITVLDSVTLKNVTKSGYTFLGWKIQGQGGYVTELKNVAENITVVAEWERQAAADESDGNNENNEKTDDNANDEKKTTSGCGSSLVGGTSALALAIGAAVVAGKKRRK